MHWKLFATIVAAAVVAYLIIRWLRDSIDAPQFAGATPSREIGFAAIMKSTATA